MAFSFSLMIRLFAPDPAIHTVDPLPSSSAFMPMAFLLRRAARIAASFSKLARSAAEVGFVGEHVRDILLERFPPRRAPSRTARRPGCQVIQRAGGQSPVTQECRIKNVSRFVAAMTITLVFVSISTDLIESLFALVMTSTRTCASLPSHGINFVNKDNTRRIALTWSKRSRTQL